MTDAAVVNAVLRRRRPAPDVREMRRLLERLTGMVVGSQRRLAELLGCTPEAVSLWERGKRRPSLALLRRLVELERQLKAGRVPGDGEAEGARGPFKDQGRATPLVANVVCVNVEGDQALLHFGLKVPEEMEPRSVAEVLVPKRVLVEMLW